MNKKLKYLLSCILFISVGVTLFIFPIMDVWAVEGGQVGHDAVIELYAEDTIESSSSSSEQPTSSSKPIVEKPKGKYPSTGEVIRRSLALSGSALALIALIFFIKKRREEREEVEK
ncbi:LPXTG cell wall anchor domain-containing protein [Candidatus Enterococcus mansonii]|uniref:Gram-positive cocci surface proteins LPxTG domain-containing protein n=1 Tax=Candidatus Enterococcus mansonii TaxID=1834181 RepID=A0A242CEU6_9ENTE|nr:LPXTG cell wall anchor domain-containing protein [Enterococcus sp. 4G2_DIV0659]OTO08765.1 hypothetical protein A5880_001765 [Enterococcus sp. 4G2_DIV0659]